MTQHPDLFAALAAPFDAGELKQRSQAGRQMPYVTARTIMNRLDEVLGPENWWDEYVPLEHSVICRMTIRLPDGTILTKSDAGGYAGLADPGDDDKSGFADAFKRTAVKFGVGRYLYRDGVPRFARQEPRNSTQPEPKTAPREHAGEPPARTRPDTPAPASPRGTDEGAGVPRTGRALFAWTKEQDGKFEYGLLKHLNAWAKSQDLPARMVDWDADQVSRAHAEARRRLRGLQAASHRAETVLAN
jgi:Rad52/22 family double-strand break repair protein